MYLANRSSAARSEDGPASARSPKTASVSSYA